MTGAADLVTFAAATTARADAKTVLDVLRDLSSHLEWAGRRSSQKRFRLLTLDAPSGPASVGTRFASTGAAMNGTFHDSSVVTEVTPGVFAFETDSRLDRTHGDDLVVHFVHRYELHADGTGTRIDYTCRGRDAGYVPYWLRPGMRRATRSMIDRSMRRQLRLLAGLAEERALTTSSG